MALNQAQLMAVPGGPGVVGAVKAGTGIAVSGDGTISLNPAECLTRLVAGPNVSLNPTSGVGTVTITGIAGGGGDFAPGTTTIFAQASAPAGWSQVVTQNNKAIRVASSNGGVSGGSVPFTTVFASQPVTGTVSLSGLSASGGSTDTVNQTPSGSVSLNGLSVGSTSISTAQMPGHTHGYRFRPPGGNFAGQSGNIDNNNTQATGGAGGGGAHNHSVSGSGSFNGNNMSHSHSVSGLSVSGNASFNGGAINLAVQYLDVILCTKS